MAVPAVVYLVVNLISYPALERISTSVFTAISQLKVLATAFFAVLMLGTPVSVRKWRTLSLMVLGVTLVSLESAPPASPDAPSAEFNGEYIVGILCAGDADCSPVSAPSTSEMVLKRRGVALRMSRSRCVGQERQLALYSVAIYLPTACLETGGNVLRGWTPLVWGIACLHAAGGILVALSVLYTSSITKTVAVCASLVLTTVLGNVFFDAPLNGAIMLGCFVVILTVFGYRDDCDVDEELRGYARGRMRGGRRGGDTFGSRGLESLHDQGTGNCSREVKSWASHKLLPSYKTLFVRGRNLALTAVYKCTRDTFHLSPRVLHAGGDALHGDDGGLRGQRRGNNPWKRGC